MALDTEPRAPELLDRARSQSRSLLSEPDAKALLAQFGIAVPRGVVVEQPSALLEAAKSLAAPYVLKLVSPEVIHKSDVGAVAVNLPSPPAVVDAAAAMLADPRLVGVHVEGFLVEEMVPSTVEMTIGGVIDPKFGPVLMLGMGGIFLEVLRDVAFRVCPITEADARDMLTDLRGLPLLQGVRGMPAADVDGLVATALAIGGEGGVLVELEEDILELDINPLLVGAARPVAADARLVLRPGESS